MAGRKKQPIDLIAAKGRKHLTFAEYAERKAREIIAPNDNIETPDFLNKKEKELFERIAKSLTDIGIMTNLDCHALGMYIKALSQYKKAIKRLDSIRLSYNRQSKLSKDEQLDNNWIRYNYQHKIVLRMERELKLLGNPFGFDPSSRCKLVLPKKEEEMPVNKFLKA
jgi:P27 family predicted phage terminase small subunit